MKKTLVFFDGFCGLCNRLIDFLVRHDRRDRLRFAPLQGTTAAKFLTESERVDLDSISIIHQGRKLRHSTAVLVALGELGGGWWILSRIGLLFPRFIRDIVYRQVASNRYKWFGKLDVCRIPTPEERGRFLD